MDHMICASSHDLHRFAQLNKHSSLFFFFNNRYLSNILLRHNTTRFLVVLYNAICFCIATY